MHLYSLCGRMFFCKNDDLLITYLRTFGRHSSFGMVSKLITNDVWWVIGSHSSHITSHKHVLFIRCKYKYYLTLHFYRLFCFRCNIMTTLWLLTFDALNHMDRTEYQIDDSIETLEFEIITTKKIKYELFVIW